MTFKILIVDDEPIIRKGLEKTIPWEENGIEVVGTAKDGEEAVKVIKECKGIDLVLTDVKMPNMDGLQLAEALSRSHPSIRIIMISGYDEFKYAQQAIQLGVKDYLLKPVDVAELLHVIDKVTREIKEELKETENFLQTAIRNAIYNQIFDYPYKEEGSSDLQGEIFLFPFLSMIKDYGKLFEQSSAKELAEIKFQWKQKVDTCLHKQGFDVISIFTSENILLTCVAGASENNHEPDEILIAVKDIHHPSFSLLYVLNKNRINLNKLNDTFMDLKKNIKYLPLTEDGKVVYSESAEIDPSFNSKSELSKLENELTKVIFQFDEIQIKQKTEKLFQHLELSQYFLEEAAEVCKKIIAEVLSRLEKLLRKPLDTGSLNFAHYVDVEIYNSYGLLRELLERDILLISKQYNLAESDSRDWLIDRARDYIETYYTNDIKVQEVADVVNISPNYFSSLFKQKTGKNFNEYINELRVEKAKVLLEETPFKVNEIAEQVGYQEYKYFVEVFKKFSGMTPTKYRKLVMKNTN